MTTVQLLVVQGRPAGKRLQLPPGDHYIGRGAECRIRPDSEWVSRQHCLVRVADDGVFLRDLGSRNGTLVNGRLASGECRLNSGDRIEVGPLVFELCVDNADAVKLPTVQIPYETLPETLARPAAPRSAPETTVEKPAPPE